MAIKIITDLASDISQEEAKKIRNYSGSIII